MISGFETALGEITLVLFTTLAPTGALAVLIMGLPIIVGKATEHEIARINKYLCIPLIVSMVGLIASATHLGNPANALYVFSSLGTSPLSNEVLLQWSFWHLRDCIGCIHLAKNPIGSFCAFGI